MNDTPEAETTPKAPAMWEHWCEHPGCKKWGSFGSGQGSRTRWLCYEHDTIIQSARDAT